MLPNHPFDSMHLSTASTSTDPALVVLVRTKENTLLLPFEPEYTFQVEPPTLAEVCVVPSGLATRSFIQSIVSKAKLVSQMSYAAFHTPSDGVEKLTLLVTLRNELSDRLIDFELFG